MTANVNWTAAQTSQTFNETHITDRLAVIHSTCSSSQLYNLSFKLPTQTNQLHYLASRTSFSDKITSYTEKHQFHWNDWNKNTFKN